VIPSEVARTVIAYAVSAVIVVGLPIAVGAAVVARLRGRPAPRIVAIVDVMLGLILGFGLLASETNPALRVASILLVIALFATLAINSRVTVAGLVLIAAALPWTVFAGSTLLDIVVAHRRLDPLRAVPPLVAALVVISIGVALIRFHRRYLARHPEAATPVPVQPTARVWNAAGQAALGPSVLGLNVAALASIAVLVVGTQATVTAGHDRPILPALAVVAIGSIATGLAAAVAWAVAWPPRSRRAFEAFAWLGESELQRFRRVAGPRAAPSVADMKRYVRNNAERPEDRWIRVEVFAVNGKLDAARDMAERIPDDTPLGRVERLTYFTYIDWLGGGSGDPAALRDAIATIEPIDGDDHLRADVELAIAEVRRRITDGTTDPVAPLLEVRERLGARADRAVVAAARRLAPGYLKMSTAFVVIVTLLDRALLL
jgi:hypothetical protein